MLLVVLCGLAAAAVAHARNVIGGPAIAQQASDEIDCLYWNRDNAPLDARFFAITIPRQAGPHVSQAFVTQTLHELRDARSASVDRLFPIIYDELRALARRYRSRERSGHTLQTTALVHEVYLKLVDQRAADWRDRAHFFAIAAQAIRRILIDHARGRRRRKRGGGIAAVALDDVATLSACEHVDLLALDEALERLKALHERQARVVELRYFGGLNLDEVAEALGVAASTVDNDWAMARAWLRRQLAAEHSS